MNTTNQMVNRGARAHFDVPLMLVTMALAAFGVIAITVATYQYSESTLLVDTLLSRITNSEYGARQGLFFLVSPLAIAGMVSINYRIFQKLTGVIYILSLVFLGLLFVMGSTTSGVTAWFSLFSGYMLQPSEFAKLGVILHLARFFARKDNPVSTPKDFAAMGLIMALPLVLILMQGELGTVMAFIAFYFGMMLVSGMQLRIIAGIVGLGITALVPAVLIMRETGSYRYERLVSFIDPTQASTDAIYQARNSQIAIGNGGLQGTGWFTDGTYTALNFVPQDHTDFIFSAIGETMGFIGCMVVIVLYMLLLFRILTLAMNTYDKFARLTIVGILVMLFFHIVYNIGMTVGITPVMGIPLPFLSYGGSNLIANMAGIGLILNITLRKPQIRATVVDEALTGNVTIRKDRRRGKRGRIA